DMPMHSFGWQGGEPTIMGLDFFKKVTCFQEKYGRSGRVVSNGLQTNGTLLDDEWCRHLGKYNFLVGLSVDGPPEIHDKHRVTVSGGPSHALVMKGLEALKRNNVEFNILTLVSDSNVKFPLEVYNYIKSLGVNFHQYIECVEFDSDGQLTPYSVRPGQWGEFLCSVFDEWYAHDRYSVSVRLFDSILARMVDGIANVCAMSTDCRQYFVVEHNGDVYPCDFFVIPELKLGNIMENGWDFFVNSAKYREFGERKSKWNEKCVNCEYLSYCSGCCPKNRFGKAGDPRTLSALCEGWKMFFKHTMSRFESIAEQVKFDRRSEMEKDRRMSSAKMSNSLNLRKVGRNDPCPCGSGKKYKKCCGR
ncbi:MAG TPA: anaerobic sulfatase maturase, partial [Victivallales bacterium]|nr:anaerobic sulfatase maturase [Victivallales bacterium]